MDQKPPDGFDVLHRVNGELEPLCRVHPSRAMHLFSRPDITVTRHSVSSDDEQIVAETPEAASFVIGLTRP